MTFRYTEVVNLVNTEKRRRNMFKHMITFAAVVGLVLALAPAVSANVIASNDSLVLTLGLAEGQTFRLVFATSTKTTATSADIGYYNTFVNNAANNVGSTGSIVAAYGWTWYAIASTAQWTDEFSVLHPAVSAIDNTLTTGTGFPIYRVGEGYGKKANNYVDLWDGNFCELQWTQSGAYWPGEGIWTGTNGLGGTPTSGRPLGTTVNGNPLAGYTNTTSLGMEFWNDMSTWCGRPSKSENINNSHSLYALSGPILIIPEPATLALLGLGGLGMLMGRRRVRG
jgi:hypothetical protein